MQIFHVPSAPPTPSLPVVHDPSRAARWYGPQPIWLCQHRPASGLREGGSGWPVFRGFGQMSKTCIHHCGVVKIAPNSSVLCLVIPPLTHPPTTADLSTISVGLPLPEVIELGPRVRGLWRLASST